MHWFVSRLNRIALAKNESGTVRRVTVALAPLLLSGLLQPVSAEAQTIRIDATPSHVANTFSPLRALGSTVDRIPSNTTDTFFRADQIKQILEAGWGPVSYRQNTELFVQAWHWNPKGTWSDASGKGYFTGDATPGKEMIGHSYGYSLPHRGVTRNSGSEFDGYSRLDDGDLNTLASAPVDIAFLGIGENGHLAFNDPPADFDTEEPYLIVSLDEACRRQQVGEAWFSDVSQVPEKAISMSVRQIMKVKELVAIVPDSRKAAAIQRCFEGKIGPMAPASIPRSHPKATVYLDKNSAALLNPELYPSAVVQSF